MIHHDDTSSGSHTDARPLTNLAASGRNETSLRVLLVEPSADLARQMLDKLSSGGRRITHHRVWTSVAFMDAVESEAWQLVVANHETPDLDSFEVMQTLRRRGDHVPCVVVTSATEEVAVNLVRSGARDVLPADDVGRLGLIAERELRDAETVWTEGYRSVFDDTREGIFRTDANGNLLSVNRAMAAILGYETPEQLKARISNVEEFAPPEVELLEGLSGKSIHSLETRMRCGDGGFVWVSLKVHYVKDASGRTLGYEGFVEDVSGRRRADFALRESEERYRTVVERAAECIFVVDPETKRILEANAAFQQLLGYTAREMEGISLYDFVAHDPDSVDRNMTRLMHERNLVVGERRYRAKDGRIIHVEVSACVITNSGKESLCIVSHDITGRKHVEESLRRNLDVLLALREAGQILGSTLEMEEIGTRLLTVMCAVSGLTTAVIDAEDDTGRLRIWRSTGLDALPPRTRFSPEAKIARREVLESGGHRLFVVSGQSDQARLAGLCLPLKVQDRTVGVLEAYGSEDIVNGDAAEILSSLTVQAASALENARLYDELAEREKRLHALIGKLFTAQEEERRRVAYEVHDGLAQVAAAAYQHLQAFARFHPPDSEEGRALLEESRELMQQTVGEARRVIANLRPTSLDDFGLQTAIRLEVDSLRDSGWEISFDGGLSDEAHLPTAIETALFRIAQQALANIGRHADTKKVRISLARLRDKVRLRVRDRGKGFDVNSRFDVRGPGEKVGLASMRERVTLLGGKLEIFSVPDVGTLIAAEVPLTGRGSDLEGES